MKSFIVLAPGGYRGKPFQPSLKLVPKAGVLNSYGTEGFKIVNNCLNSSIYSYLETSGGQSSNLYLNVVHFFNTSVN
jgi:hypothetical protein